MEDIFNLNELKNQLLIRTGIRTATPSDCKRISIEIRKCLNKTVSETTIKRLFGFAVAHHKFSRFTLTTLMEYVEQNLPNTPSREQLYDLSSPHEYPFSSVVFQARRISESTFQGIKHRTGVPFEMTIERKFALEDFDSFYQSDYSFTCLISQPGYGRTILLAHLADKYFLSPASPYCHSMLLFLNAPTLFTHDSNAFNLEEQLKERLGIKTSYGLIPYIENQLKDKNQKLIIFLDGFSELLLKQDLKRILFENIINLISAIGDSSRVKLVMSMRCTSWRRFYEYIRRSAHLKSKWYTGACFSPEEGVNIPPFTEREVEQVLTNIHQPGTPRIHSKLKNQLRYPYHMQLYYQLITESPDFNSNAYISFYELTTNYIQERIYQSNYYTEKILFLKKLVQLTDFAKAGTFVPKDLLINELAAFKNAYAQLISDGILVEERILQNAHPREYVRFAQQHIFEYFLFIELLEAQQLVLSTHFFRKIKEEYSQSKIYLPLLKWAVRFMIRADDLSCWSFLLDGCSTNLLRNKVILFTAENIRHRNSSRIEILHLNQEKEFHQRAITQMLNMDFLDSYYRKSLEVLLDICPHPEDKLIYLCLLLIGDVLTFNKTGVKQRLDQLRVLPSEEQAWLIQPVAFASLLYDKLSGVKTDSSALIAQLGDFKRNPVLFEVKTSAITLQEYLSYIQLCLINQFIGSALEQIKIFRSLLQLRPKIIYQRNFASVYLLQTLATSCITTSPGKKTTQMTRILQNIFSTEEHPLFTYYGKALSKVLQSEQFQTEEQYALALQYATEALELFQQNELRMNSLLTYNLLIRIALKMRDFEKVNEYKYARFSLLEESSVPQQLFPTEEGH